MARSGRRLRGDERGQMMLLSAVVLIIGFIALAGMVGRVTQLAGQATREQDRPILREVEPMLGSVNSAISHLGTDFQLSTPAIPNPATNPSAAYDDAVVAVLRHLRQVEAGQGILMDWSIPCVAGAGGPTNTGGYASITLNDGVLQVTVRSNQFYRPAACATLSG